MVVTEDEAAAMYARAFSPMAQVESQVESEIYHHSFGEKGRR
jgi:hypothetical protein